MANNVLVTMSSMEEGNIDVERIVDGNLVPDEYLCPICGCLLWKPRSCGSCQHLFCQKCISTWVKNASSGNKCPFRCSPFEDRRCPPYVHSLLSRLNIHCRNASFGCTRVLPYNSLEQHENLDCEYLTQRCEDCEELVLVDKFNEHREVPGLCLPFPIKCTICLNSIEKSLFRDHFHSCCQNKVDELMQQTITNENLQAVLNGQPATPVNGLAFIQSIANTMNLFEQQRQMSRLPTNLNGVDAVRRSREEGHGYLYNILIMFKFILSNWSKAPFFIFMFSIGGFSAIVFPIFGGIVILSNWAFNHFYRGPIIIIFLNYILTYGIATLIEYVSDMKIMFCFGIIIFIFGSSIPMSLEMLEMNALINKTKTNIALCFIGILIMKIILLLIRLYLTLIPTYVAAALITFIHLYLVFKLHHLCANRNQPLLPV